MPGAGAAIAPPLCTPLIGGFVVYLNIIERGNQVSVLLKSY